MQPSYQNPVYPCTMADPFIVKHGGVYYAYGTARGGADGRQVTAGPSSGPQAAPMA